MGSLKRISSWRKWVNAPSWRIVFDWEDEIGKGFPLPISCESIWNYRLFWWRLETLHLHHTFRKYVPQRNYTLRFVMDADDHATAYINKNTIPVLIDFWLEKKDLSGFFENYKYCKLLLVTNKEAYDFLVENNCPIPVEHWPLSYPDKDGIYEEENYKKQYDFVIFGRPNPFFIRLLDQYCENHPGFTYIRNNNDINNRKYINNKGDVIIEDNGRKSYLELIRKTRISCYSTPGIDEAKKESSTYNQVTPRLFEMLCGGLHVIGHYPDDGADVKWYKLSEIIPNVNDYNEFEKVLDNMLKTDVDLKKIKSFMSNHYTSTRVPLLKEILRKHGIDY